ncbi:MAG TPA: DUF167 domain-containing protein [Burkholderiales bacterium]|nr:DUF167 domain-containing protein [Burkholderiales bacterium]
MTLPGWARYDASSRTLTLLVHAQPGARSSGIAGEHGGALKIRIAAPAIENKANAAIVAFIAETLQVPPSRVTIRRGAQGRRKTIEIRAVGIEVLAEFRGKGGLGGEP